MFHPRWQVKVVRRTPIGNLEDIHDVEDIGDFSPSLEDDGYWKSIVRVEFTRFSEIVDVAIAVGHGAEV